MKKDSKVLTQTTEKRVAGVISKSSISVEVPCVLHGHPMCPHPDECDGFAERMCKLWEHHSSR